MLVDDALVYAGSSGVVAVANRRYFGGGMAVAPKARLDDGLFDIVILGAIDRRLLVGELLPRIYRGTHLRHRAVHLARGARVAIEADTPLPLEVDGEIVGTAPAHFTLEPRRIGVFVASERASR